jgi:hypothetical protein
MADAFEAVLTAAERMATWSAALMATAVKLQNDDAFDWHNTESVYEGIHHRYQAMSKVQDLIDNNVS